MPKQVKKKTRVKKVVVHQKVVVPGKVVVPEKVVKEDIKHIVEEKIVIPDSVLQKATVLPPKKRKRFLNKYAVSFLKGSAIAAGVIATTYVVYKINEKSIEKKVDTIVTRRMDNAAKHATTDIIPGVSQSVQKEFDVILKNTQEKREQFIRDSVRTGVNEGKKQLDENKQYLTNYGTEITYDVVNGVIKKGLAEIEKNEGVIKSKIGKISNDLIKESSEQVLKKVMDLKQQLINFGLNVSAPIVKDAITNGLQQLQEKETVIRDIIRASIDEAKGNMGGISSWLVGGRSQPRPGTGSKSNVTTPEVSPENILSPGTKRNRFGKRVLRLKVSKLKKDLRKLKFF
jgi:hypothetical protein